MMNAYTILNLAKHDNITDDEIEGQYIYMKNMLKQSYEKDEKKLDIQKRIFNGKRMTLRECYKYKEQELDMAFETIKNNENRKKYNELLQKKNKKKINNISGNINSNKKEKKVSNKITQLKNRMDPDIFARNFTNDVKKLEEKAKIKYNNDVERE